MSEHLFIGGCKDGVWMELRDRPRHIHVMDYTCHSPFQVTYIACPIGDEGSTHVVYVEKDNIPRILELLLQGYNP